MGSPLNVQRPELLVIGYRYQRTYRENRPGRKFPEKECAQPVYEYIAAMPIYIYETTDPSKPIRTFEVKQSVHDDPLRSDPKTGEGARRVISAGYSVLVRGKSVGPSVGSVGSH